jgi:hypothetical protein
MHDTGTPGNWRDIRLWKLFCSISSVIAFLILATKHSLLGVSTEEVQGFSAGGGAGV